MPFDGNGHYSLPAGNPFVTGTVINSTTVNNTLADIAAGISTALTKDGQTTATGNIPLGGFKLTGAGTGTNPADYTTLSQVTAAITAGGTSTLATLGLSSGSSLVGALQSGTGAVAITLQDFLRGVFVTLKQFGAVLDGTTDDSAAVQLALNTGKAIYLAAGVTCYCASTVTMSVAGTLLFGPGTLKFNAAAAAGSTLLSITANRCTVDGITIDMASANTARAITPIGTDGTTIRSVTFLNGGQFNIRASGLVRNLKVLHCVQQTIGYMVLIQDPDASSYGFEAIGNVFEHPASGQGDCIEINAPTNGFTDFVITGNRITGAFGVALVAGIGIGVANGQRGTISDNIVTNCEGDGIHVENASKSISILGNTVTGCATSLTTTTGGIGVANSCQDIEVDGNTVNGTGSLRPGIATFSSVGTFNLNITISNNVIDSTPKEGMSLDSITVGHVRGNTITNPNTTNTATIAGIRFPGFSNVTSRVQVRGNTIVQGTNAVRSVIFATPAKATQCTVAENDFTGCTTPSIDDGTNAVDRFGNRMSTDSMYGTLTLTAGTATTVANGNTNTIQNIVLTPSNAAARALGVPFVASIVSGTSFTLTSAVAAGTETYSYRIL